MTLQSLPRRHIITVAAGTAALLSMRQSAAQTRAAGGDWLGMVKAHHQLVAKTFEALLASQDKLFARRERLHRVLHYQLTAHSVAEENVLYPALAKQGLVTESDGLYLDQAHAKVKDAELAMATPQTDPAWFDKLRALQAAVLKHALEDEEGNLFPKLQQALDSSGNAMLTAAYQREFASVRPDTAAV